MLLAHVLSLGKARVLKHTLCASPSVDHFKLKTICSYANKLQHIIQIVHLVDL